MTKIIQIFEHQQIRVGQDIDGVVISKAHLQALAYYHRQYSDKYFSLTYNGVKFSHYVGVIQIGNLTIEILPKTDAYQTNKATWQRVLLDMLRQCNLLSFEALHTANLRLKSNSILELYYEKLLVEIEKIVRKGLLKSYQKVEVNLPVYKGQIIMSKQITHNYLHKERLYARQSQYNKNHLVNKVLMATLCILERVVHNPNLAQQIQQLKQAFVGIDKLKLNAQHFYQLEKDKNYIYYKDAIEIAKLICLNYSPDIRGGQHHLVAILFDMNLLFEEYIYQKLRRLPQENLSLKRQEQKSFWQRRKIRPDIVLTYNDQRYVIDTKWKTPHNSKPSMDDLKQLFVYCQYFDAPKSLLIYPKIKDFENTLAEPYHDYPQNQQKYYCQLHFAKVLEEGKLNPFIGEEILSSLID